jgi:magnesium-transporting ATPase (P-type)
MIQLRLFNDFLQLRMVCRRSRLNIAYKNTVITVFKLKKKRPFARFFTQFHNVLIYVLVGAAFVTALLGHWVDSGVIFAVVIINAIIGFIQEGKAEKALDAIRKMLSQQAMVKRDGKFISLPAEKLVPGDVVLLQSGDKVPADLRLFKNRELRIEEAMLTGESLPVEKNTLAVEEHAAIGDRKCLACSGTLVTYGQGQGVVIATGDTTEIGRISGMLRQVETLTTPLLRQMATLAKWLTAAIGIIAAATFAYGHLIQGYPASDMFLANTNIPGLTLSISNRSIVLWPRCIMTILNMALSI